MPDSFSCITCQVLFKSPELQREHYKSDWHRYNLKRKVAAIPSVTLEEFETRVKEHKAQMQDENRDESHYCKYCSKLFNTTNAYNNHLNSKKHKLAQERTTDVEDEHSSPSDTDSFVKVDAGAVAAGTAAAGTAAAGTAAAGTVAAGAAAAETAAAGTAATGTAVAGTASAGTANASAAQIAEDRIRFTLVNTHGSGDEDADTESDIEELDSDEWEECRIKDTTDSLIKPQDCLFCNHHSRTMMKNLKHMMQAHSFFIPDIEYCIDVRELLLYLGEKVSLGYMCLWCNETGRTFYSMEAVRCHMIDKGHCKLLHEGVALAEYADFYDYTTSYPDQMGYDDDMDVDEEVDGPVMLEGDDYQLVLPSGITVGHRTLMRFYKQNLTHNSHAMVKKSDRKLHKLLSVYRALGWAPKEQAQAAKTARDIHFMKRVQAKWQMKLSVRANKFQKHYRAQVNF